MTTLGTAGRSAGRNLYRHPVMSASVVLTLALAMAAAAAVAVVVEATLLRPLPVADQDELVVLTKRDPGRIEAVLPPSGRELEVWRDASRTVTQMAGMGWGQLGRFWLRDGADWRDVRVQIVTQDFYRVLGVQSALGRLPDGTGSTATIVLSERFFRTGLGSDSSLVGGTLTFRRGPYQVSGVAKAPFAFPDEPDIWLTLSDQMLQPNGIGLELVARMAPGVTIQQVEAELGRIARNALAEDPDIGNPASVIVAQPFAHRAVGSARSPLLALAGGVALLFLIAVVNVANLLLLRAESRHNEYWIRSILGASRRAMVGHVMVEAVVLAAIAGVVGALGAGWATRLVLAVGPDVVPVDIGQLAPTAGLMLVVALALVAAVLMTVVPALVLGRGVAAGSATRITPSRRSSALGRRLVSAQVALAAALLVVTGLLVHSFIRLQALDRGYDASNLVVAEVPLQLGSYQGGRTAVRFFDELSDRLAAHPNVRGATPVMIAPFTERGFDIVPRSDRQSSEEAEANPWANVEVITENYLSVMGLQLVAGRTFTAAERGAVTDSAYPYAFPQWGEMLEGSPVMVSAAMARSLWPGESAVGHRFQFNGIDASMEVVGVVADARYRDATKPRWSIYLPPGRVPFPPRYVAVRTAGNPDLVMPFVLQTVRAMDAEVPLQEITTVERLLAREYQGPRLAMTLLAFIGIVALVIATIGTYGTLAVLVERRVREIGIRMALGASPGVIRALVLHQGLRIAAVGLVLGVAGGVVGARRLDTLLFGVHVVDPASIGVVILALGGAVALASAIPAGRAVRVDPIETMNEQ